MAANATSVSVSHFSYASFISGFHDYKDLWTPEPGEVLEVEAEPSNPYDPMATAVKKNGQVDLWKAVVDWCKEVLPPIMTVNFGPTCTRLLLSEGGKAEASG